MAASVLLPRSARLADDLYRFSSGAENTGKRGRKKTVSWPCDENLCEVRQFMAEDIPSIMGLNLLGCKTVSNETPLGKRARLEAMSRGVQGSSSPIAIRPEICLNMDVCMRPGILWHHPQKFILDNTWLVAGGNESTEVSAEIQRETRVLETFYPLVGFIPDSPAEPYDCCNPVDNANVFSIPLKEVEIKDEEDVIMDISDAEFSVNPTPKAPLKVTGCSMAKPPRNGEQSECPGIADPNIAAAAAAACMAVNALGKSDLVDRALLVHFIKNPSLLESLMSINHVPKYNGQNQLSFAKSSNVDHGSYSNNGSPVSVLTNWGEDALKHGPQSSATNSASNVMQQPKHASSLISTTNVAASSSRNAPNHLFPSWRLSQQDGTQVQSGPPIACNLQTSSLGQDGRSKIEARSLVPPPNRQGQPLSPNMHSMQAVNAPTHSYSVASNEASLRACQAGKQTSSRRVVEGNNLNGLQRNGASLGAPVKLTVARTKRLCIYFNTPKGCRKGGNCAFLHQSLNTEINSSVQ